MYLCVCVDMYNTNASAEMVVSVVQNICVYMCSSSRKRVKIQQVLFTYNFRITRTLVQKLREGS